MSLCRDQAPQLQVPVATGKRKRQKPKLTVDNLKVMQHGVPASCMPRKAQVIAANQVDRQLIYCRNDMELQKFSTPSLRSLNSSSEDVDMR